MSQIYQPSLNSGEISPRMYGRVDQPKFAAAVKTMKNFICHPTGGASNRAGTEHVTSVPLCAPHPETPPRLIQFQFSSTEGFLLVFGDYTLRIVQDGELVMDGGSPVELATPYGIDELADLNYAQSADVLYLVHPDYAPRTLVRYLGITWVLQEKIFDDGPWAPRPTNPFGITFTPTASSGTVTVQCNLNFFTADMADLQIRLGYASLADPSDIDWGWGTLRTYISPTQMTCDLDDVLGYQLVYNGSFEDNMYGWMDTVDSGNTVAYNAGNEAVRVTGAFAGFQQKIEFFSPGTTYRVDVGFANTIPGTPDFLRVLAKTSATYPSYWDGTNSLGIAIINGDGPSTVSFEFVAPEETHDLYLSIDAPVIAGNAPDFLIYSVSCIRADLETTEWRMSAYKPGPNNALSYPSQVFFHEQRLCLANTASNPQTVWMSRTGNFDNFGFLSPGQDDDSVTFSLASRRIDAIKWVISDLGLLIGTHSAVWRVDGGDNSVITPTSIKAVAQTADGCAALEPLPAGPYLLYLQRGSKIIRGLSYSQEAERFLGADLSIYASHLFESRAIVDWDYQPGETPVVWCACDDGVLLGMTYVPEHEVIGWHQHHSDNGAFAQVCTISTASGDEVYVAVKRSLWNSVAQAWSTRYTIERFRDRITLGTAPETREYDGIDRLVDEDSDDTIAYYYWFVDCGVIYDGAATTLISGVDHLDYQEVDILADGAVLPRQTVIGGTITLPFAAGRVILGLPIAAHIETLPLFANIREGTQGRTMAVNKVTLRVHQARGLTVSLGGYLEALSPDAVKLRDHWDEDNPIALRTGEISIIPPGGWEPYTTLRLAAVGPVPLTILAIIPEVSIGDV